MFWVDESIHYHLSPLLLKCYVHITAVQSDQEKRQQKNGASVVFSALDEAALMYVKQELSFTGLIKWSKDKNEQLCSKLGEIKLSAIVGSNYELTKAGLLTGAKWHAVSPQHTSPTYSLRLISTTLCVVLYHAAF
jgi:hypothetical protein